MKRIALIASTLLTLLLVSGCGEDGGDPTSAAQASATGSGGGPPSNPIVWEALPTEGAPAARYLHTAVWTGSKMIIWGGMVAGSSPTGTGAAYDPQTRAWSAVSAQGAPAARYLHTAV